MKQSQAKTSGFEPKKWTKKLKKHVTTLCTYIFMINVSFPSRARFAHTYMPHTLRSSIHPTKASNMNRKTVSLNGNSETVVSLRAVTSN